MKFSITSALAMSLFLFSVMIPVSGHAKPSDLKKFKELYPDKASTANCKTCHTAGKNLNDYGNAIKAAGGDIAKAKFTK